MIEIYHLTCEMPAFLYDHMPVAGEVAKSEHARTLDGSRILPGTKMCCGSCGKRIEDIRHLAPPPLRTFDLWNPNHLKELTGKGGVDVRA